MREAIAALAMGDGFVEDFARARRTMLEQRLRAADDSAGLARAWNGGVAAGSSRGSARPRLPTRESSLLASAKMAPAFAQPEGKGQPSSFWSCAATSCTKRSTEASARR